MTIYPEEGRPTPACLSRSAYAGLREDSNARECLQVFLGEQAHDDQGLRGGGALPPALGEDRRMAPPVMREQ